MISLALLLALAAEPSPTMIVESETFGIDWPTLDGWDCQKDNGRDRLQMFQRMSGLKLVRTLNGAAPATLFDCSAHEMGGSKTSRWERGGICAVAWSVSLNLEEGKANKARLDVTVNDEKLEGYQCVRGTSGERA